MCWTARPASPSGRSRSGRFRNPTFPASNCRPRSRFTLPPPFERMSYTVKDVDQRILTLRNARDGSTSCRRRETRVFDEVSFGTDYFIIMMPGHSGGANLFATSGDPETGTAYVISKIATGAGTVLQLGCRGFQHTSAPRTIISRPAGRPVSRRWQCRARVLARGGVRDEPCSAAGRPGHVRAGVPAVPRRGPWPARTGAGSFPSGSCEPVGCGGRRSLRHSRGSGIHADFRHERPTPT